jgi:hypothetical protein
MKSRRPKSNALIALPIMFGLFVCTVLATESGMTEANKNRIFLVLLSSLFWAPGVAILATGYRWKNLAPGTGDRTNRKPPGLIGMPSSDIPWARLPFCSSCC